MHRYTDGKRRTVLQDDLTHIIVERKLVGSEDGDDAQRYQYATESIRRGLVGGYIKEDGDTTLH